ncbi:MAG: phage/plasmid primase, P4 family [Candidatus Poribacteria bacterium]|nr:phage/plasmid primase, P4 family [Candidatus Poribacteria bacterium]
MGKISESLLDGGIDTGKSKRGLRDIKSDLENDPGRFEIHDLLRDDCVILHSATLRGDLSEDELESIRTKLEDIVSGTKRQRGFKSIWDGGEKKAFANHDDSKVKPIQIPDSRAADRFCEIRKEGLKYIPEGRRGIWLDFRSDWEESRNVLNDIRDTIIQAFPKPRYKQDSLESISYQRRIREYASGDSRIATKPDDWDKSTDVAGLPGGLHVDLLKAKIHPAKADRLIRMRLGAKPERADKPEWDRFYAETIGPDPNVMAYVWRFMAYMLTARNKEQKALVLIGEANSGKTTLVNVLMDLLGDYSTALHRDVLYSDKQRHLAHEAKLRNKRLAVVNECRKIVPTEQDKFKSLVGGDMQTADAKYQDPIDFRNVAKLLLVMNPYPQYVASDAAMARRLVYIPCNNVPKVIDESLPEKLRNEYSAILYSLIEECAEYCKDGLLPLPESLQTAKADLLRPEGIAELIEYGFIVDPKLPKDQWVTTKQAHEVYEKFVEETKIMDMAKRKNVGQFIRHMRIAANWIDKRVRQNGNPNPVNCFAGVKLKPKGESPEVPF